jgi:type IV secretory pathway VirB10-like protein
MSLAQGEDPRLDPGASLAMDNAEPLVAGGPDRANLFLIVGAFAVLALGLFLFLNAQRMDRQRREAATAAAAQTPAPPLVVSSPPLPVNPALVPQPAMPPAFVPPPVMVQAAGPDPQIELAQRLRAPAVVVDLQSGGRPVLIQSGGEALPSPTALPRNPALPLAAGAAAGQGNPNQAALDQLSRAAEPAPETAVARQMGNLGAVVTQGAMIPAVLETALNSDLPGYARAIVSRDVRSFDGRTVLIPRSSRLIGEYRSAVSLGQSRAFVIWTRVIRPDGVSVQIGSPGADALGRAGLQGDVDRHFFSRFGGSILLSVLNAGVAAASRTPATQIVIGSPAAAAAAAGSASFGQGDMAPTIKIAQGEAIRIFVARDLDFSAVAAKP